MKGNDTAIPIYLNWHIPLWAAILLLLMPSPAWAQQKDDPSVQPNTQQSTQQNAQQKIQSLKAAYLTQQLNLSPAEAQKFWPVYNQYQKDLHQLSRERKQSQLNKKDLNSASDKQIDQSLDQDFNIQQRALQLREQYRKKFQDVIPKRKVLQLYKSEKDFNLKLIKELRQRRNGNVGNPRPGNRPNKPLRQAAGRRP